ncbi:MAG: capsule assembly Wzi family protein [Candidatus Marinimicrobia bacterium]|nr:capsule assembly Wzi family protein [Candidatus Neomarinimicrobiota bacterium]
MNKYLKITIFFVLLIGNLFSSQLHVSINDPIYLFLDRMATTGIIRNFFNDELPLNRDEISESLVKIYNHRHQLSTVDNKLLIEYINDYRYELGEKKHWKIGEHSNTYFRFSKFKNYRQDIKDIFSYRDNSEDLHLFAYEKNNELLWLDFDFYDRVEIKNSEFRHVGAMGFIISSQIGEHFSLYVDAYQYGQSINDEFTKFTPEMNKPFRSIEGNMYNTDKSDAYIQHSSKIGIFTLGQEPIRWGNSKNTMILGKNNFNSSFAFVKWERKFHKSKFTFLHGSLLPENYYIDSLSNRRAYRQKYIVGHRWDFMPFEKLHFGFTEMTIYGERNPELVYFIPTIFLWSPGHNLMDRDNTLMAVEFEYFPINRMKFYGTWFLDELSYSRLFTKWWANKFGYQMGLHLTPDFKKVSTDFNFEFSTVRPWTYTHKYSINSFTHAGENLGFEYGPNTQLWELQNRWWITKRQILTFEYQLLKRGVKFANDTTGYDIGNDVNQNYENRNPEFDYATDGLMGDIIDVHSFSVNWFYHLSNDLFFTTNYKISKIEDEIDNYFSVELRFKL